MAFPRRQFNERTEENKQYLDDNLISFRFSGKIFPLHRDTLALNLDTIPKKQETYPYLGTLVSMVVTLSETVTKKADLKDRIQHLDF